MVEKNIIFIDFENLQYIKEIDIKPDTKIIVLVGLNQNKSAINFAINKLDYISSIELIQTKRNVNIKQENALDFFIAHYLGIYLEKYFTLNLNYLIYSNDKGFDPLIKHLVGNNVSVKRIELKVSKEESHQLKNDSKINISNKNDLEKYYKKLIDSIKKTEKNLRPKTKKSLEGMIITLFPQRIKEREIYQQEIMEKIIENKIVVIDSKNKVQYNV
jgi:hypothetical protein